MISYSPFFLASLSPKFCMTSLRTRIVITGIVASLSLLGAFIARVPLSAAQEFGTVIVDQGDTPYLGQWGLATPTGVISGETRLFTGREKPVGNYSLTVTPPAGAVVHIDVYNEDTLTRSVDSRTAPGALGSGGTLRFAISYDLVLMGTVVVTSKPSGLQAVLKGPRGSQTVTTPFTGTFPEGTYSVTYVLPAGCRPVPPIARNLQQGGRITFTHESRCPLLQEAPPPSQIGRA